MATDVLRDGRERGEEGSMRAANEEDLEDEEDLTDEESLSDEEEQYENAEEYVYQKLCDNQIRLLEILPGKRSEVLRCRLQTVSLDSDVRYGAVSYTWGTDMDNRTIMIDGKRLSVKPNLAAALREFRRDPPWAVPKSGLDRAKAAMDSLNRIYEMFEQGILVHEESSEYHEFRSFAARLITSAISEYEKNLEKLEDELTKVAQEIEERWNAISGGEGVPRLYHEPRLLWIDGVCINQNDIHERSAQVKLMWKIYAMSACLIVWLGPRTLTSDMAFFACRSLEEPVALSKQNRKKLSASLPDWIEGRKYSEDEKILVLKMIGYVMGMPWFTRAWVIQEYVLGGTRDGADLVVVCCGTNRAQGLIEMLNDYDAVAVSRQTMLHDNGLSYRRQARKISLANQDEVVLTQSETSISKDRAVLQVLLAILSSFKGIEATDPRDLIYSVLGLATTHYSELPYDLPDTIVIDYTATVADVYSSVVKAFVEAFERIDILCFCNRSSKRLVRRTWTPDWTVFRPIPSPIWRRMVVTRGCSENLPFDASYNTKCSVSFPEDLNTMIARGFVWDTIMKQVDFVPETVDPGDQLLRENLRDLLNLTENQVLHAFQKDMRRALLECLTNRPETSSITDEMLEGFNWWLETSSTAIGNESKNDQTQHTLNFSSKQITWYGSVFITEGGHIGRTFLRDILPNDKVCILFGCAEPMILRAVDDHYEVVEQAWIPGIMHGEAMITFQDEGGKAQEFELW